MEEEDECAQAPDTFAQLWASLEFTGTPPARTEANVVPMPPLTPERRRTHNRHPDKDLATSDSETQTPPLLYFSPVATPPEEIHRRLDPAMARYENRMRLAIDENTTATPIQIDDVDTGCYSADWRLLEQQMGCVESGPELPPFSVRNGSPFSGLKKRLISKYALDESIPIAERKVRIVRLLDQQWVLMRATDMVGEIVTAESQKMQGRNSILWMPAKTFIRTSPFMVSMPTVSHELYDQGTYDNLVALFGDALVKGTAKPVPRKHRGRPPGDDYSFMLHDNGAPARVPNGSLRYIHVNLSMLWYKCTQRRYWHPTFNPIPTGQPGAASPGYFNTFEGWRWSAEEVRGCCRDSEGRLAEPVKLWKWHVKYVISNSNGRFAAWLHYWTGHMLQTPGIKFEGMPVLIGEEGTGKGNFVQTIAQLIGMEMVLHTAKIEEVAGHFTDRLKDVIFVVLDEAKKANGGSVASEIKILATELSYRLREMYCPTRFPDKFFYPCALSNDPQVVEAGAKSRRFFMERVSERKKGDFAYHKRFTDVCWSDEGLKAILDYYLNEYDLERANEEWQHGRVLVKTKLLAEQQLNSMKPHHRWMYACLWKGKHVDSNRLLDANDEKVKYIREQLLRLLEDAVMLEEKREKRNPFALYQARRRLSEAKCWQQMVSFNDLYSCYEHDWKHLHGSSDKVLTRDEFIEQLQVVLCGNFRLAKLHVEDIFKLADTRNHMREHLKEVPSAPPRGQSSMPDFFPTVPQPTSFTTAAPESDYYVILPPLHACREAFIEHFGFEQLDIFKEEAWSAARGLNEALKDLLHAEVITMPQTEKEHDAHLHKRRRIVNQVFHFVDADEFEANGAYFL